MKFETKYLIRWGIPGWLLIFWLFYEVLFLKKINPLETSLVNWKTGLTLLVSLAVIGVFVGYILHQVYFGIAWVLNRNKDINAMVDKIGAKFPKHDEWIKKEENASEKDRGLNETEESTETEEQPKKRKKKKVKKKNQNENYYQLEYVWHSVLLNLDSEKRAYIQGRYRYMLGTIHSLGSLFISSVVSLIVTIVIIFTHLSTAPDSFYFWIGVVLQLSIMFSAMVNYKYFSDNLTAFQVKFLKTYL
ncbi:BA5345 family protein [Priestia megaterium]|uniref:hypothetical protein n=1 Tax=Priestia megaterium TaxID=1404 RepID=UPI001649DBE1|nr:hypothetical protein [Priestia megaterium]